MDFDPGYDPKVVPVPVLLQMTMIKIMICLKTPMRISRPPEEAAKLPKKCFAILGP